MFVAIILTESKVKVVIPISWFASIDIVQIFNIGKVRGKVHKNFRLPLRSEFDEDVRACYNTNIFYGFGKWKKCANEVYFVVLIFQIHKI